MLANGVQQTKKTAAQLAVIEAALGNEADAQKWAEKADQLSRYGDNIERALEKQLILPAEIGLSADNAPKLKPASELLKQIAP